MKKVIYVFLFTLFGVLLQFFIHAVVEITYINLLLTNFEVFGLGLSFATWFTIHNVFAVVLLVSGLFLGFKQGLYWWKRIYVKENKIIN